MNNKLDYLAQKEEELRRLNEQLDAKSSAILDKGPLQPIEESYGQNDFEESIDPDAAFKGKPLTMHFSGDDEDDIDLEKVKEKRVEAVRKSYDQDFDAANSYPQKDYDFEKLMETTQEQERTI